jgi:glycogen synthase
VTRILTITNWYPPHHYGGYELSCFDVMTRLSARGHDVRVLCSEERLGDAEPADPDHERLVSRELQLYMRRGELYRPSVRERLAIERHNQAALARLVEQHQPEVVSVWHMGAMSLGLLHQLVERGVPIVYAVCDDWLTYEDKLDAWSDLFIRNPARRAIGRIVEKVTRVPASAVDLGASGVFCFISECTRRRAIEGGRWSYPLSTVVYSGIERRSFQFDSNRSQQPWQWRLLFTGRFDARKGVETALRALPLLPSEATLLCDGRGGHDERARLWRLACELGVEDRVKLVTSQRNELAAQYRRADVFVFPSVWEEPFGLTPLEAMACGTPVVATGVGGSTEYLRDGYNALLFDARNPDQLAHAVLRLHEDPGLRGTIIEGGLHTASELDVDNLADVFESWHVAAADGYPSGGPPDRQVDIPEPSENLLTRHQAATPSVVSSGDPDAIKRLYVELGDDWSRAATADDIPVLSAPETQRVVTACFHGVRGLVLDAGCGPNPALAISLASRPDRCVVTLDIGWGTVRAGRIVAAEQGANLLGVVGDVERLPFRNAAFDAVACDDTIEHLPDDASGVAELARVLRLEGTAVLATPNRSDLRVVRAKLRDRYRGARKLDSAYYCSNSHLREYTWTEFERLTTRSFGVQARHPVGWERGWKGRVATSMLRIPPLRRFSQMIVIEAKPL